jgi:uncharacterized protein YndB with AHSA1/START domain
MPYSIYHDLIIKAPVERVYQAISRAEQLINWWPYRCSGIAKEGETFNFYFSPEYDWYAKVIRAEENKALFLQMTRSDADWESTSFGFELEEGVANQVRVKFQHTNWKEPNENFRHSSFCWAMLLNGMKNYVEKGEIIPFEERE